ncbi:hypothetical protein GASC598I20_005550, partial [Gilliamella apicola SCGC AB-598-I20]
MKNTDAFDYLEDLNSQTTQELIRKANDQT